MEQAFLNDSDFLKTHEMTEGGLMKAKAAKYAEGAFRVNKRGIKYQKIGGKWKYVGKEGKGTTTGGAKKEKKKEKSKHGMEIIAVPASEKEKAQGWTEKKYYVDPKYYTITRTLSGGGVSDNKEKHYGKAFGSKVKITDDQIRRFNQKVRKLQRKAIESPGKKESAPREQSAGDFTPHDVEKEFDEWIEGSKGETGRETKIDIGTKGKKPRYKTAGRGMRRKKKLKRLDHNPVTGTMTKKEIDALPDDDAEPEAAWFKDFFEKEGKKIKAAERQKAREKGGPKVKVKLPMSKEGQRKFSGTAKDPTEQEKTDRKQARKEARVIKKKKKLLREKAGPIRDSLRHIGKQVGVVAAANDEKDIGIGEHPKLNTLRLNTVSATIRKPKVGFQKRIKAVIEKTKWYDPKKHSIFIDKVGDGSITFGVERKYKKK